MNLNAKLTNRERQIAELSAWGACKKEIAQHLVISVRTVENHFRHIYEKTGCSKANELSAWWFCTRFRIPFALSPMAKRAAATILLTIYIVGSLGNTTHKPRVKTSGTRINTVRVARNNRRKENNIQTLLAA